MSVENKVLIVGGGIGGLALALALEQQGVDFQVVEAASEIRLLGVGINVLPHAVGELESLGVVDDLKKVSVATRDLRYLNRFGQKIISEPRGMYAGHSRPQLSIHRGKLHGVLMQAVLDRKGAPGRRCCSATNARAFAKQDAGRWSPGCCGKT